MRGFIALLAGVAAFVVPVVLMGFAILELADNAQAMEMVKAWLAYIGPFAATIVAFYFKDKSGD